ncbi:MAG: hypothetical protein M1812_004609 [Candelaria pacifica]|nr:MAG: hypothetical protein M1812_004609 [Candelaria pacifica]
METVNAQLQNLNVKPGDTSTLKLLRPAGQDELFDAIDQLRSQGMDDYVSLPQLIVCGNQSSGKSSVLEAISGVRFPTNHGVCTRFATEVMLRRAPTTAALVKIRPGAKAPEEHRAKLDQFTKREAKLDHVPGLIEEAKKVMDLEGNGSFCDDILQVELSGPDMPHLTLVDLPGWIERENDGQTPKDVEVSKGLVKSYAVKPRSIILAVIEATHDHHTQAILRIARDHDPMGFRTLGIITKPDIASLSSESVGSWIKLAKNESTSLRLGWHVLKNADEKQRKASWFHRDGEERSFFREKNEWKTLPSDTTGVEALRPRLSRLLAEHIRDQLPILVVEIEVQMEKSRKLLKKYGPPRPSSQEQRLYLTELAGRFQYCTRAAVAGDYTDPYFQAQNHGATRRLRATIRSVSESFAIGIAQKGHKWEIVPEPSKPSSLFGAPSDLPAPSKHSRRITRSAYVKKVQDFVRQHKGRELPGTSNPLLIGEIFMRNSESWEPRAKSYVEDSLNTAKEFVYNLLDDVADQDVKEAIAIRIIEPAMEKKLQALRAKVEELMKPYKRGYAMTYNPLFVTRIQSLEKERQNEELKNGQNVTFANSLERMDYHACSELLDRMLAYYDVALHVFVDNMTSLAVENCLLDGLEDLLSPYKVAAMTDEELRGLAAETQDVQDVRIREEERCKVLDSGLTICNRHVKRKPRQPTIPGSVLPSGPYPTLKSNGFSFGTSSTPAPRSTSSPPNTFGFLNSTSNGSEVFGGSASTTGFGGSTAGSGGTKSTFGALPSSFGTGFGNTSAKPTSGVFGSFPTSSPFIVADKSVPPNSSDGAKNNVSPLSNPGETILNSYTPLAASAREPKLTDSRASANKKPSQ